jgi:hypothetical protein
MAEAQLIREKIAAFQRKYYLNLLVRGVLLSLAILLSYFLLAAVVEHALWLSPALRLLVFLCFFVAAAFCVARFLWQPLAWWLYKKGMTEEQSAALLGQHFPTISDKLLNFIQLLQHRQAGALAQASIGQRAMQFAPFSFEQAVDMRQNMVYLRYLGVPFAVLMLLLIFNQNLITASTTRIVRFRQEFSPQAPFRFVVQNPSLRAYFNEDFTLRVQLTGEALPNALYLVSASQRLKFEGAADDAYIYTFQSVQQPVSFQLEAAGFFSPRYELKLVYRPDLVGLQATLQFPAYLQRPAEVRQNSGPLELPEGTRVTWRAQTSRAASATFNFASAPEPEKMQLVDNDVFTFSKVFRDPDQFTLTLANDNSENKDRISYPVSIIKDQYPEIVVDQLRDSVLFQQVLLAGRLTDDYGLSKLQLHYEITRAADKGQPKTYNRTLPLASSAPRQNFFFSWPLDSLQLQAGDKITYYLQVWDNDGVNGRKATRSAAYALLVPDQAALKADISKTQQTAEKTIERSRAKAKTLQNAIEEARQKLRGKQMLDWQDKKMLEDLIRQKQNLDKSLEELQKENALLEEKKDAFSEESERLKEKAEQIQELMNELLDEETKKLFEELQKMLRDNADPSQMQKLLDKMNRKEMNLEKELERTLELFKELQYDYQVEQTINELKKQTEAQEKLLEKTENLDDKKEKSEGDTPTQLANEQEKLNQELKNFEQAVEDLKKMGEELEKDTQVPDNESIEQVDQSQKESQQSLEQNQPKKSAKQQQKAVQQMKQMQQQLENMQSSMQMEMDMQNLDNLRHIIHGLVKLSFDQEALMKEFNAIQQTDPRYVALGQGQLKVKDDVKVLEDSLLALAKKDPFMGSVVGREVGELNTHLDKATENIKERRKGNASAEMQLAMTSINNLALMLNDHFDMMMQMMANARMKPGKSGKQNRESGPSLGELQQQLNDRINQLKQGGQQGRQLSEELAKAAAEQERIRRALQEMQEKLKKEGGKTPGGDLPGKMEQTEMDLVNKQITEQTLLRQKEILTRLLETEKSMREQEQEEERKAESAKDYQNTLPRAFEDYLRLKEKEVDLLKTVPPRLFPYYKKEVSEYFKRLENQGAN